mmetsp:Transcript_69022/g.225042  ORF Transcript_69022/g.225042 Transcript_69022/m.225042 type:complete len:371 (-) Transcript_69022:438-1550(-)
MLQSVVARATGHLQLAVGTWVLLRVAVRPLDRDFARLTLLVDHGLFQDPHLSDPKSEHAASHDLGSGPERHRLVVHGGAAAGVAGAGAPTDASALDLLLFGQVHTGAPRRGVGAAPALEDGVLPPGGSRKAVVGHVEVIFHARVRSTTRAFPSSPRDVNDARRGQHQVVARVELPLASAHHSIGSEPVNLAGVHAAEHERSRFPHVMGDVLRWIGRLRRDGDVQVHLDQEPSLGRTAQGQVQPATKAVGSEIGGLEGNAAQLVVGGHAVPIEDDELNVVAQLVARDLVLLAPDRGNGRELHLGPELVLIHLPRDCGDHIRIRLAAPVRAPQAVGLLDQHEASGDVGLVLGNLQHLDLDRQKTFLLARLLE